jgi:hypothetical protein
MGKLRKKTLVIILENEGRKVVVDCSVLIGPSYFSSLRLILMGRAPLRRMDRGALGAEY